MTDKLP
jgi:hypothetical protein